MSVLLVLGMMAGQAPATQPADPSKKWDQLPPVGPDFQPYQYQGRVVGFTKTGFIVKPEGVLILFQMVRQPDGLCKEVAIYRQDNTRPPREFVFDNGLFPNVPGVCPTRSGHYVTDVRIGDIVVLYHQIPAAAVPLCNYIMIFRRPGGKVPPAIEESKWDGENSFSNRRNAEQFVEEKVVPVILPRLFRNIRP